MSRARNLNSSTLCHWKCTALYDPKNSIHYFNANGHEDRFKPAYKLLNLWKLWFETQWYKDTGDWINIKMSSYQYRKFHCGDKTVVRSYADKMTSLYWIRAQISNWMRVWCLSQPFQTQTKVRGLRVNGRSLHLVVPADSNYTSRTLSCVSSESIPFEVIQGMIFIRAYSCSLRYDWFGTSQL